MDLTHAGRAGAAERRPPIDPRASLNEIVEAHPAALAVLDRFGFDTCCGGALPLESAARRHAVEMDELLAALEEALSGGS